MPYPAMKFRRWLGRFKDRCYLNDQAAMSTRITQFGCLEDAAAAGGLGRLKNVIREFMSLSAKTNS